MITILRKADERTKFTKHDLEDVLWLSAAILVPVTVLVLAALDRAAAF